MDNLKHVLGENAGERELKAIARQAFYSFGKYLADFLSSTRINRANLAQIITTRNEEHFERAYKEGKGVIALTAHLGNWELGGMTLALRGYPMNAIVLRHADRRIDRLFVNLRVQKGIKVIPVGMGVRNCYRALKRGEVVAVLGDMDIYNQGLKIKVFGKEALLPRGPGSLAINTGAWIVPGFVIRDASDKYVLFFEEPFRAEITGEREKDLQAVTEKIARVLEKYLRKYPEQWTLFHPLWKEAA